MKINRQKCGPRKGKLSYRHRKLLPNNCFAIPGRRWGPMYVVYRGEIYPDAEHAVNAKARATQAVDQGRMTAREHALVERRANRIIALCKRLPKVGDSSGRGKLRVAAYMGDGALKAREATNMYDAHKLAEAARTQNVDAVVISDESGAIHVRWERKPGGWRCVA